MGNTLIVGQVHEDVKGGRFLLVTYIWPTGGLVEARTVRRSSAEEIAEGYSWKWSVRGPDVFNWQPDHRRRQLVRMRQEQMQSYPVVALLQDTLSPMKVDPS